MRLRLSAPAWLLLGVLLAAPGWAQAPVPSAGVVVNDITQLNPIKVDRVVAPHSIEEIQDLVRSHPGPISVGGGRYSMGGQTATEGALQLDMREFNRVVAFAPQDKTITVQTGITWRKIQDAIDLANLSLKIMQTYSNFTVGGSLSVNVHGRYIGQGPLVRSVRAIKIVLADGSLVECSPTQNAEIFYGAIGGYGGLGVIVEAMLDLADNVKVERRVKKMPIAEYRKFFAEHVRDDKDIVFHNGDIYPPGFDTVNSVSWYRSDKPLTIEDRLRPVHAEYRWQPRIIGWLTSLPFGREWLREYVLDPWVYRDEMVVWRNHEASYDVAELEPASRKDSTYVLQEYFIPVDRFDDFVPKMAALFQKYKVNLLNVSIRHALPDPGTLLAWARGEVFSFVVYHRQGTSEEDRAKVGEWTRAMIDEIVAVGGAYYLPYQIHATDAQFHKAYPRADEYFALKGRLDPQNKFRNKLLDAYYPSPAHALKSKLASIKAYARPEVRTYLSVPEWYIVFNPEEYANYLRDGLPSHFPYFASIREFWRLYSKVNALTKDRYASDGGSQLMLMVIGSSYTIELAIKGLYENTLGRLSEWTASNDLTEEDALIQQYNDQYVKFIYVYPWYEFPFWDKLKEFWSRASWDGAHKPRKLERRLFFSAEYAVKSAYGWLIKKGTKAAYDEDEGVIYCVVENLPEDFAQVDARIKLVERFADGRALIAAPRYEPFREIAVKLATRSVRFDEISGNREIVLTAIAPKDWGYDLPAGSAAFDSAVVTDVSVQRVGIRTPTRDLGVVLTALGEKGLKLEHLYDY